MKAIINSISFYFLLPAYLAAALVLICFNVPESYYYGFFIYYLIITLPVLPTLLVPINNRIEQGYQVILTKQYYRFISLSVCFFILLCSPLDVYVNGFKLFSPDKYAEFHGVGRYIRHVTILCWLFIPIAFIFLRTPFMKFCFISYAILFPILIMDRNRFFISCYSLFLCIALTHYGSESPISKLKFRFFLCSVPLCCLFIFGIIGHFRSGTMTVVQSSGQFLQENAFPLADFFAKLPSSIQQFILYITTPIFNFATVVSSNFINKDFLLSQFSPFSRELFPVYPYSPVLVPRFNVGTEFYPFLLYGGLELVVFAFLGMFFSFILALYLFKRCPNIFSFLIFIRISYNALFMGFAPQFYLLLNLVFVILMLALWFFAELIRISRSLKFETGLRRGSFV